MRPASVPIGHGVSWFAQGWRVFTKSPGVWIAIGIILFTITVVLSLIPVLGYLVGFLVTPALIAGMVYGAAQVKAGRQLAIEHLFRGFQDQKRIGPLLTLGAVMLGTALVSLLIVAVFLGASMVAMMSTDAPHDMVAFGTPGVITLLLLLVIHALLVMALVYAIPLVMLGNVAPGAAMRSSIKACLRNLLPLFVFCAVYFVVAIIATLPILLGWIVLLPWSAAMLYSSYSDLYG